ncbi:MAG TPA: hypothetical protein VEL74_19850 [Thermoanaerobaculia bacterium]|nr:hypothetical protein [Thermoanaerobaculia bacterium]
MRQDLSSPTLIIPRGTRIEVDPEGQLSIQAPGNLVIQNSGKYGTLESVGGSIRIDRGVEVEANTVRCTETCYVQGFLTAWKVIARSLQLEESARAHVVLQETERLEIGRDARLVGNFSSEKEMVSLFSRFAHQVRSIPFLLDRKAPRPAELSDGLDETIDIVPQAEAEPAPEMSAPVPVPPLAELPDPLLFALVLLQRESERRIHPPAGQRAIDELIKLLEQRDVETLAFTYRTLFNRVPEPRDDARRARQMVTEHFAAHPPA